MFFLKAKPESDWHGVRGVSEITVRPEIFYEADREFQVRSRGKRASNRVESPPAGADFGAQMSSSGSAPSSWTRRSERTIDRGLLHLLKVTLFPGCAARLQSSGNKTAKASNESIHEEKENT